MSTTGDGRSAAPPTRTAMVRIQDQEREKREKENFLMFTRVLMKWVLKFYL